MTVEELCVLAMARAGEVTNNFPSTRSLMYRRVGVRQQQLVAAAAQVNPDYFGAAASGTLTNSAVDMADMEPAVPNAELVSDVVIDDAGTSGIASGTRVNIVRARDEASAALPPRATIRNGVIRGVGTDLNGVTSLKVYYAAQPAALDGTSAAVAITIPEPHSELLVCDLTRYLLMRTVMDTTLRQQAVNEITAEETDLMGAWLAHVRAFAPVQDRFSATA